MCGIAGLIGGDQPRAERRIRAAQMAESLAHRGPDDAGVAAGDGWALAMRRLAVQDTSAAGHQPMTRGAMTIVFNGEVYNFPVLREELRSAGYQFSSESDTEVVLNAFREWGPACFGRFNGMFAMAIVDDDQGRFWLARDRFGKKPLFVARLRSGLAFASELKAIIPVPGVDLELDRESLAGYFRHLYVPAPKSIFRHVFKLPSASWVEGTVGDPAAGFEPQTYWRLPERDGGRNVEPEEVLDALRTSTQRRLLADVPVGAFLSGGIDSSLVVASMAELEAETRTFCVGFEDQRYDESPYARAVAAAIGTVHRDLTLTAQETLSLLFDMPRIFDEPFADSSAIPMMAVSRLAREDVTVVLSGDGGDELFAGYPRYRVPRPIMSLTRFPRAARAWGARSKSLRQDHARVSAFLGAGTFGAGYSDLVSAWRSHELGHLMPGVAVPSSIEDAVNGANGDHVDRMMRADASTYLVDDILQKVDRATMAVGLEGRAPFLDPAVVELAMHCSPRSRGEPGHKQLLRQALSLRLPAGLIDRPKKGFSVPIGDWLRGPLRSLIDDLVLSRRDAEYDLAAARTVCRAHLDGEITATPRVWSLVAFELWRQQWLPT